MPRKKKSSRRGRMAKRMIQILDLIILNYDGPFRLHQLHEKLCEKGFKCSQRTVRRDLKSLEENNLIRHEKNKAKWIKL